MRRSGLKIFSAAIYSLTMIAYTIRLAMHMGQVMYCIKRDTYEKVFFEVAIL